MTAVYFAYTLPLVLGGDLPLPLSTLVANSGTIALAGLLGMMAYLLSALLPFVGRSHAVATFIGGVVVCRLLAGEALQTIAVETGQRLVYPDVWASIGFLAIAVVFSHVAVSLASLPWVPRVAASPRYHDDEETDLPPTAAVVLPAVGMVGGTLPVFMYIRYALIGLES
jgi:hypothetical protein